MNRETPPDSVLELLRKVKALADAGAGGERAAARARLDALLAKHGVSEKQLAETEVELREFRYANRQEELLLITIAAKIANGGRALTQYHRPRDKGKLWFKLTRAQAVDVETQFAFYLEHWAKEMMLFFRAFIFAQDLGLAVDEGERPKRSDEEQRDIRRLQGMQFFVDRGNPRKTLEGSQR